MIKEYYQLTKPGVLYGNALTAVAGFLLAARGHINFPLFLALVAGMTLVIASACVINNYLDQDIDRIMERTKKRPIVAGAVKGRNAVIFSIVLGILGISILYLFTNMLVVWVAVAGFIDYVVLYGMLAKRLSIHGTLVGSISGAMPILAGYCAVTNRLDIGALLVFLILFIWQMPEFYSISIYRHDEYKAAKIPVMSVVKGIKSTKIQIVVYIALFTIVTALLTVFGYTGYIFLIIMTALNLYWFWLSIKGFKAKDTNRWARKTFRFSLVIVLALCVMLAVGPLLP